MAWQCSATLTCNPLASPACSAVAAACVGRVGPSLCSLPVAALVLTPSPLCCSCCCCPPSLQPLRHLLVELCLLLPAQLRVLVELVLLPRLVVPLAAALSGPDELVAQGLRTAEYWVGGMSCMVQGPACLSSRPCCCVLVKATNYACCACKNLLASDPYPCVARLTT
jgi:hypothetical protein